MYLQPVLSGPECSQLVDGASQQSSGQFGAIFGGIFIIVLFMILLTVIWFLKRRYQGIKTDRNTLYLSSSEAGGEWRVTWAASPLSTSLSPFRFRWR
jgi:hypothetical protein